MQSLDASVDAIRKRDAEVIRIYQETIKDFIPDTAASILVCGAGISDQKAFGGLAYTNVTYSGMDLREAVLNVDIPKVENAENLSYADDSFDYVVMRGSIHHCRLPHKVLTELYRVSRKGFLAIESRDSSLMRLAERLGLAESYEVAGNSSCGGVNGTDIPNFIYRWTEREIEKTIKTYAPHLNHRFKYRYSSIYPVHGFRFPMNLLSLGLKPVYSVFCGLFPRQQNQLAFFVQKPDPVTDLKPWLSLEKDQKITVNREWIASSYTKRKSR